MFNVNDISNTCHAAFEVAITVSRTGEDDRTEYAVVHLGAEEWHTHGGTTRPVQLDMVTVKSSVDIEPGDTLAIAASTGAVPSDSTWTVRDRVIDDADRHLVAWRITQQGTAV